MSVAGSLLEADHSVKIIDARIDDNWEDNLRKEISKNPLLVCLSSMSGLQIKYALEVSRLVNEIAQNDTKLVWGGPHPTLMPHQTIQHQLIDALVIGEGEIPLRNMVSTLKKDGDLSKVTDIAYKRKDGSINITPKGELVDVNTIPELPYDIVDVEKYIKSGGNATKKGDRIFPFITSRGCPYRCTFCSTPSMNRFRWRPMDKDLAYERIMKVVRKYNIDVIRFYDENFTSNPKRAVELADKINGDFSWYIQARLDNLLLFDVKRLEKNGLYIAQCGVESGSERILKIIDKGENIATMTKANRKLAETNINVYLNFMIGFPTETKEEVMQTVDLSLRMLKDNKNAYIASFYIVSAYLGTPLFDFAIKNGFRKVPQKLEDWIKFYRQNVHMDFAEENRELYEYIAYTSKFLDGKYMYQFFKNTRVPKPVFSSLGYYYRRRWRKHNFNKDLSVKAMNYIARKKLAWV